MIERNVEVGRGEIDLLALDQGRRVAVEVRATTADRDPSMPSADINDDTSPG